MRRDIKDILNIAEFILATPTLFYSGWVFFKGAYYGLKNRFINMDVLVSTGASLAYVYSIWAMFSKEGEVYFDSVTMIITFVLVGKYLEVLSKKEAVDTLDSLLGTSPTEVTVINNNEKSLVAVENVKIGDMIELKPGEKVAIDGKIVLGSSNFDESSLTGESIPIYKKENDEILSGSMNIDGVVRYKATKDFSSSMLSTIANLLEDSITKKPHIEQLANKVSGIFSVTILTIAILTFIGWYFYAGEFEKALIVAISVIVIACPCALGLATPMATLLGVSIGAKKGILFKEAAFIETMAKSNTLVLDKTGTITQGKPTVIKYTKLNEYDKNILYSLLISSSHPISKGVLDFITKQDTLKEIPLNHIKNIQAKGIEAFFEDKKVIGGNLEMLQKNGINFSYESNNSLFIFAYDNEVKAVFELKDQLKKDAKKFIDKIQNFGIEVIMLTGDNDKVAHTISQETGIKKYYANLLPQDKLNIVEKLQKDGKIVVMAGDGINDSLALAKSNIAIAMGSGADIAIGVSDIVLIDDSPKNLYLAYKISKRSFLSVKENLSLSVIYNIIAIPLAVGGFVNPLVAALSMSLSSLIVVGNSFRIYTFFKNK
jgi:Cu+-exporting ATPase